MKRISSLFRKEFPFFVGIPSVLWQVVFFYVPLFLMVLSTFLQFAESGQVTGITLEKASHFMEWVYLKIILSSLCLGLFNAIFCLAVAYPLAYFMAFPGKKVRNLLLFFLIVPFWTNFLLHIYAWFFVLEKYGFLNQLLMHLGLVESPIHFLNSLPAIAIMMLYYYLPFMVLPIYSSLERFDHKLIEASLDLGASWWQTARRVIIPLSGRGIRSGFFLVFIPSFGEFAIPELMGGDKWIFVGNVISRFILGQETGEYGAAFTVIASLFLLATVLLLNTFLRFLLEPRTAPLLKEKKGVSHD